MPTTSGLTIISRMECGYCHGEGTMPARDPAKKRIIVRTCPVCQGNPDGAPTIQGDVIAFIRRGGK